MTDTDAVLRARFSWVLLYQKSGNAGLTCRRCGISRPTLRKWWRRYQEHGEEGLQSQSRRRHVPPDRKVTPERERLILELRRKRKLGPKGLQSELNREHGLHLSTSTVWHVLNGNSVSLLRRSKIPLVPKRYSRPIPGERVQIDTCKVGRNLYQFTAIDDCTRMRVLAVYPARTARNAVDFLLEHVLEEFPFPIQRIQTDRGSCQYRLKNGSVPLLMTVGRPVVPLVHAGTVQTRVHGLAPWVSYSTVPIRVT